MCAKDYLEEAGTLALEWQKGYSYDMMIIFTMDRNRIIGL